MNLGDSSNSQKTVRTVFVDSQIESFERSKSKENAVKTRKN
jgi:hypothetical protein